MGRKNNKAKEKRMKFKEESAKIGAKQQSVDAANAQEAPMANLAPFKKYDRNGLNLTLECHRVEDMDEDILNWAFNLTRKNMKTLYETSDWGWNDSKKKEEMSDDMAWYLIARDVEKNPMALIHFRFDLDNDVEVLYCYEIQLMPAVRRKGLGKFMMQILELLAHKAQMTKVMCTVFNNNEVSRAFFMNKLKYEIDETSPSESMEEALYDEEGYTYQILCKKMSPKAKPASQTQASSAATKQNEAVANVVAQNGHVSVES